MYIHKPKSIEKKKLNIETVIDCLCSGERIIFVTDQGKLIGAMTDGDINRCVRAGGDNADSFIVNHNIRSITKKSGMDNRLLEKQAQDIFSEYHKIHNLPIVDEEGILLYQIDRDEEIKIPKQIQRYLDIIRVNGSIGVFLDCYKVERIILVGGTVCVLNQVKHFLQKEFEHSANVQQQIKINIVTELENIRNIDRDALVISMLNSLTGLLNILGECKVLVRSLEVVAQYFWYKKLDQIYTSTYKDFFELFGYDEMVIKEENHYLEEVVRRIEQCGICIRRNIDASFDAFGEIDILFYSAEKKYKERISLERLYNILQWLQSYRCITSRPLTRENYICEYISWMEAIEKEGFAGVIIQEYSLLDCEAYQAVREWGKGHFVIKRLGEVYEENLILVNLTKENNRGIDLHMDIQADCCVVALNCACYDLACRYCNNVYVHMTSWRDRMKFVSYVRPGRGILNYINQDKGFPEDFIEKIYGEKNYPAKQVIEDSLGCEKVCFKDSYVKYRSNYQSEYFNTDSYGNRITVDMPEKYIGTIYLLGTCLYVGYAVEDKDTTASILQRKLNVAGKKYRVINLGGAGIPVEGQIEKLCDRKIGLYDIVVCWLPTWNKYGDSHWITVDIEEISGLSEKEYWDDLLHCGKKGYEIIANQIYENLEPKLQQLPERGFHLQESMEKEIASFLLDIKHSLQMYDLSFVDISQKVGAIVMNCNPFTYGHKYLIETASRLVNILYIFVVEEDKSVFPFEQRIRMVREGTKEFSNVVVLPSGKFMISSATFPGYFTKGDPGAKYYDSFLDLKIFAHYIAPSLGISLRFIGEEPFDQVTAQYNHDMKLILEEQGVTVVEIPRKKFENEIISATKVRMLMEAREYSLLQKLVPDSTFLCIQSMFN